MGSFTISPEEFLVRSSAQDLGVDPDQAARIAHAESGYDQNAVSPKGARGVMQLMPGTAKDLGVDPGDMASNIEGGVRYYKTLLDRYNGDERKGDNLYTSSVVALEAKTGKLSWYRQFTPHDVHDWDSAQPMVLVDRDWAGHPRKLLLHADRNGFFFVLDRTNGEMLHVSPFVRVTWATGYGQDGRPILAPNSEPTVQGTFSCPGYGGTTWMSAAFNPVHGLYYIRASGNCSIFKKSEEEIDSGERTYGGTTDRPPGPTVGSSILALDIATGQTVWKYPLGSGFDRSGTLSTAGDVVFFGQGAGGLVAVHAQTGKTLWHADMGQNWWASPMTYMVGGKQYVAIAGPAGIFSFSLPAAAVSRR